MIYSRHPFDLSADTVLVDAVWGLGPYAVDGIVTPDSYMVAKDKDLTILKTTPSHKPVQLTADEGGGFSKGQ